MTATDEDLCKVAKVGEAGAVVDLRAVYELGRRHGMAERLNVAMDIARHNVEYRLDEVRQYQRALRRRAREVRTLRAELTVWRDIARREGWARVPATATLPCPVCRTDDDGGHKLDCPRNRGRGLTLPIRAVVP